uniref:HAT C-terminal dimerisation domain-containing protein n=1 Tax=Latimeria chalumnae TaxID=7897 RepID=H3B978_LATCH
RTCCSQDISIAAAGWNDISKHLKTDKHKNENAKSSTVPFFSLLKEETCDVTKAECCFVEFLIEHNLLLSVADHAAPLFKAMFADSKIAKDFSCRRMKTSHIIHTLAGNSKSELVSVLKRRPFCLATDGSNDIEDCKLYPIVVRVFNDYKVKKTCLLFLPELKKDSTAVNIYDCIRCQLETLGIPRCSMIAFTSDNASVMPGSRQWSRNSTETNTVGCPCHLIHITADKATDSLPISVEDIVITNYYYLKKSSKRKRPLRKFQELYSVECQKIIKHVHTRWLSLGKSLKQILLQWEALHEFFRSEESEDTTVPERLCHVFGDPNTKLYFLVLDGVLPVFEDTNKMLQSDEPLTHVLHETLLNQLRGTLVRFVKPDIIRSNDLLQVPFEEECNHKTSGMIMIGRSAEHYIKGNQPQLYLAKLFKRVVSSYATACQYMKKKFPYCDPVLLPAEVASIKRHEQVAFQSVEYFVNRFPALLPTCENTPEQLEELQNEFLLYQVDSEIDTMSVHRIDHAWVILKKYKVLSDVMLGILVILHSNADCERVFSIVTKKQTASHSNMS